MTIIYFHFIEYNKELCSISIKSLGLNLQCSKSTWSTYLGRQSSFGSYPSDNSLSPFGQISNYYMAGSGQCSIHILRGPWSTCDTKVPLAPIKARGKLVKFHPFHPQGQTKAPEWSWFASFNKNSLLRCPVIKKSLVYSGRQSSFGSHPSDKEGKLVKFRQLSNSRKWSTTDHQLLPAAKHHSSFFIIFSLEIKIKCLLSFANPSFQTPKVPTGISYVNLKEPSPASRVGSTANSDSKMNDNWQRQE